MQDTAVFPSNGRQTRKLVITGPRRENDQIRRSISRRTLSRLLLLPPVPGVVLQTGSRQCPLLRGQPSFARSGNGGQTQPHESLGLRYALGDLWVALSRLDEEQH
jgi:hypothetical protein